MQCKGCGDTKITLDENLGEYYCSKCGLVVEDQVLDFSQVYLPSADGKQPSGAVTSFVSYNKGLGTLIDAKLPVSKRLKSLHLIGTPTTKIERSFSRALPILESTWNILRVPKSVKAHSAILYYKCIVNGITQGRKTEEMVSAVVYIACVAANTNQKRSDVARILEIPERRLKKQVNQIKRTLDKDIEKDVYYYIRLSLRSLNVSTKVRERIQRIISSVSEKKLEVGKHPAVVAGEIIYRACLGCGEEISQIRIAKSLNISERSIRRTQNEWKGMVLRKSRAV